MAKKKLNRVEQMAEREKQRKLLFETIAKTPARKNMVDLQPKVDLHLIAEIGGKFANEDKDFFNKTKAELDAENVEINELNESFLGIATLGSLGPDMYGGKKKPSNLSEAKNIKIVMDSADAGWLLVLLNNSEFTKQSVAQRIRANIKKSLGVE